MKHLTVNEIINFVSMTDLNTEALKNASAVTGHITECEDCLRTVRAFQTVYDEFIKIKLSQQYENAPHQEITPTAKRRTENNTAIPLIDFDV